MATETGKHGDLENPMIVVKEHLLLRVLEGVRSVVRGQAGTLKALDRSGYT